MGCMGYDLHITRAENWTESSDSPIGYEEWIAYAEGSESLAAAGTLNLKEEPTEQTIYQIARGPNLHWWRGEVVVTGADEGHVDVLRPHAVALAARLQGDDGEVY